ncbi:DUF3391 domain-containing protein [Aquabacterium sp. A7-Y]|uniref:HD-GYP domain-containing protein n=1 Tax=Aquabacterium sp. A7-Y TaxID=1349605 RepID=UPI00223D5647|nr:HD-GYP domain-containing protein [Aquabacterium sp. A7-Y]MCW7540371.1 DUF3391 domain-containing protein [Aquabacterium sp. A7-Y]
MKDKKPSLALIDVQQLQVGMHVHLDVGWMAHPFARSNFRIVSAEQIEQIAALGLNRVRWNPERSDPGVAVPGRVLPGSADPAGVAPLPDPAAEADLEARRQRRELLSAQQASLAACEREFAQAGRAHRQVVEQVLSDPDGARRASEQLIEGFVEHVGGAQDSCIRLLGESAGDRAACHSINVTVISVLLGKACGLQAAELTELGLGALLHDIGKIELPERVRTRHEHLTLAELQFYQEHVAHGVDLARRMQLGLGAALVIAQHHEHADGSGFPQRLNGARISRAASIVALVNRYDNLCNPSNAAKALTPHEALSLMFSQMKARFDAGILGSFIKMMGVYPPGSVVQLNDDRYALVASVSPARPLKPCVIVHEPSIPREEALVLNLEDQPALGIRRSLKPSQLTAAAFDYLAPRQRVSYFFERSSLIRAINGDGMAA